jgi:uncharacterized membrane protein YdjX (TVP38/TMEM64 family)
MSKKIFSKTNISFFIFLGFIALFIFSDRWFSLDSEKINAYFETIPLMPASVIFVLFYVLGTFIFWQLKDPLKIVSAVVFGAYLSTLLIYIAEIVNAYIFFTLSKVLGRKFVEKKIKGKFRDFYEQLSDMNIGWVFTLRFVPLIPYRVLDLSFGLSNFPFRKYLVIVLLASPIRIFAIQFVLASLKEFSFIGMQEYFLDNQHVVLYLFLYFAAALIVVLKFKRRQQGL